MRKILYPLLPAAILLIVFTLSFYIIVENKVHPKTGDIWRYSSAQTNNPYRKYKPFQNDYLVLDTKDGYILYLDLKFKTIGSSSEQMFTFNSEKIKTIIK